MKTTHNQAHGIDEDRLRKNIERDLKKLKQMSCKNSEKCMICNKKDADFNGVICSDCKVEQERQIKEELENG